MDARRRTLRLRRGGAPVSDTPYSDIEFPLKLRKWKALNIHEPTLLADYTMSESEFWERANRVASHYEDCSKRVSNDPNSWNGNRDVASGVSHKRSDPLTFIQRIHDLNPRKSPHDRWTYDNDNKYALLRAVREAERQCTSRRLKIKKNADNLTAKNKQNKINAVDKKRQHWNTYNREKKKNLRVDEINELKEYFNKLSGKISPLIDFDELNNLLDDENIKGIKKFLSNLRGNSYFGAKNKEIRNSSIITPEKQFEIAWKLDEYLGHLASRHRDKPMYNRSNIERNKFYESDQPHREKIRAKELEGLF
jgi:hypothetical protein